MVVKSSTNTEGSGGEISQQIHLCLVSQNLKQKHRGRLAAIYQWDLAFRDQAVYDPAASSMGSSGSDEAMAAN